jgi:integrase
MVFHSTKSTGVSYYESESRRYNGRPDRCFYIRYKINGKVKREKIGWLSEGHSVAEAANIRAERLRKKDYQPQEITLTVSEAVDRYFITAKNNKSTWKDDVYRVKVFVKMYGAYLINDITTQDIETYMTAVSSKTVMKTDPDTGEKYKQIISPATRRHYLQVVQRLFNYLSETGLYHKKNPTDNLTVVVPDNTVINPLTDEECRSFIDLCESGAFRGHGGQFLLFALYTGLRASGIYRMKWEDVDIKRKSLRLQTTKNKRKVTLLLSDSAISILNSLPQGESRDYVFPSYYGGQKKNIRTLWEHAKKQAGIRQSVRFHDLRHTFATLLGESGVDLEVISKMLHHSDISITMKYAHVRNKRLQQGADTVDRVFSVVGKDKSKPDAPSSAGGEE